MSTQKKQGSKPAQIQQPKFASYRIKVEFSGQTRYYEIPYDIELRGLLVGLRKWFNVPQKDSIFLCLRKGTRILNFETRLSQLTSKASLLTEKKENPYANRVDNGWKDLKESHQFMEKDVVKCEAFIELKMMTQETTG